MADPAPRRSLFAIWHWPRWTWAVVVPLMIAAYVFSEAAVVRMEQEMNFRRMAFPAPYWLVRESLYKPANWLFDNTPLRYPLEHWFSLWGVSFEVTIRSAIRTGEFNGTKN